MSIVVLEAGICGTPVLFTDNCGLESLASTGAGVMVSATPEDIGNGICSLLKNDHYLKEKGDQLANLVRNQYLWEIQAKRYFDVFAKFTG